MFLTDDIEVVKTQFVLNNIIFFSKFLNFVRRCRKILQSRLGRRWQHGARLQRHTQNIMPWIINTLHFNCNNGCTNAPECCVICIFHVLSVLHMFQEFTGVKMQTALTRERGNPDNKPMHVLKSVGGVKQPRATTPPADSMCDVGKIRKIAYTCTRKSAV